MKIKTVNQYQCEYCGKKNYSAPHMRKHEKHCTMNPDRGCRVCDHVGEANDLSELKDRLQKPEFVTVDGVDECTNIESAKVALKDVECPACKLAALRQVGYHPGDVFDYKEELKQMWYSINGAARMECELYCY